MSRPGKIVAAIVLALFAAGMIAMQIIDNKKLAGEPVSCQGNPLVYSNQKWCPGYQTDPHHPSD